jgi:mono/diheme cytochrome c family protein
MIKPIGVFVMAVIFSPVWAADGAALFAQSCALCHQSTGEGVPGQAPPLADRALWSGLGERAPDYIAGVMLAGLSGTLKVGPHVFSRLVMPPQDRMTDEELTAIGNYVLETMNSSQERLTITMLGKLRMEPPTHKQLVTMRPPTP